MQGCFPFRTCLECLQGPSFTATQSYAHLRDEKNDLRLDVTHMGIVFESPLDTYSFN
jgi:hypothetical protein